MASRDWQHEHVPGGIAIGGSMSSYGERRVVMINPTQRQYYANWGLRHTGHDGHSSNSFVLAFGAYGTCLHVYADSLDTAIEECAAWLAEYAPGHIMQEGSDEHKALIAEVCEERAISYPEGFEALEDDDKWAIHDQAEADLTRTESGFLTSYEWTLALENPTTAQLYSFIRGSRS